MLSMTHKFPAWGSQGGEQEPEPSGWTGEGGACQGGGGHGAAVARGEVSAGHGGGHDGGMSSLA